MLVTPWYGGHAGGVAVFAETLAYGLERSGWRVIVLTPVGVRSVPRFRRGRWGELICTLTLRGKLGGRRGLRGLSSAALDAGASIILRSILTIMGCRTVHFQYIDSSYGAWARRFAGWGCRVVATFHGSDLSTELDAPDNVNSLQALLAVCDATTAVSSNLAERLETLPPPKPVSPVVIVNPVPPDVFDCDIAQPESVDGSGLLFIGKLIPRKACDVLIEALTLLQHRGRQIDTVIIGEGPDREHLEALVSRMPAPDRVQFAGSCSRQQVVAAMRSCRVFVLPSRREGFPLVVAEALWMGRAVVATAVDGIAEQFAGRDVVSLVSQNNAVELADAIEATYFDEATHMAYARAGWHWAREHRSPLTAAVEYSRLY